MRERSALVTLLLVPAVALLAAVAGGRAAAQPVLIVARGDAAPGGGIFSTFTDAFEPPAFDGQSLAFRGVREGGPSDGVFRVDLAGGGVEIADGDTPQPGTLGTFDGFGQAFQYPSIEDGRVLFVGSGATETGVYRGDGGPVERIADTETVFPDATATILGFDLPASDGRVVVTAHNSPATPHFSGVYSTGPWSGFRTVADSEYVPPAGAGFFNLSGGVIGGGRYAFHHNHTPSGPHQIWIADVLVGGIGPVERLVGTGDPLPGSDEDFFDFLYGAQLDRSRGWLCFLAQSQLGTVGVYLWNETEIVTIADTSTPVPDGTGTFTGFGLFCSIHEGDVVFEGSAGGSRGVYWKPSGRPLAKVLATGDAFAGGTAFDAQVGREAIHDERIAMQVRWSAGLEGYDGLAVTNVPEPGAAAVGAAAVAALGGLVSRRRRRAARPAGPRAS